MSESQKSVLVVDDDSDIRANIEDILTDFGYRVETAEDGHAALRLVEQSTYDVALLDYKMPSMDGATLYRRIKEIRPETVAIMVTAYAGSNGAQEALDAGTWRVLRKPVDVSELMPLVAEASQQPVILLVDDDPEFCDSMWDVLREQDFRVCIARSEEKGLERIQDTDFQIALIDLKLGTSGNGKRVIQTISDQRPDAKACIITGTHDKDVLDELQDAGICVCVKPLETDALLEMINSAV